ncbi:MAG: hypothetical protein ABIF77_06225 [bacterium]
MLLLGAKVKNKAGKNKKIKGPNACRIDRDVRGGRPSSDLQRRSAAGLRVGPFRGKMQCLLGLEGKVSNMYALADQSRDSAARKHSSVSNGARSFVEL